MAENKHSLFFVDKKDELDAVKFDVSVGSKGYVIFENAWYQLVEGNPNFWQLQVNHATSEINTVAPILVSSIDEMTDPQQLYVIQDTDTEGNLLNTGSYYYYNHLTEIWEKSNYQFNAIALQGESLKKTANFKDILTTPFMSNEEISKDDGKLDITNALKDLINQGYKNIYIPEGEYLITESIYLPINTHLWGAGNSTIIYAKICLKDYVSDFSDQTIFHENKTDLFRLGLYTQVDNLALRIIGNFDGALIAVDAKSLSGEDTGKVPTMRGTAKAGISIHDLDIYVEDYTYSYLHCAAIRLVAGSPLDESGNFVYTNSNFYDVNISRVRFTGHSGSWYGYKQNWGYFVQIYSQSYQNEVYTPWTNSHIISDCIVKDCRWAIFTRSHDAEEYHARTSKYWSLKTDHYDENQTEEVVPTWEGDLADLRQNGFLTTNDEVCYDDSAAIKNKEAAGGYTCIGIMQQGSAHATALVLCSRTSRCIDAFPMDWHLPGVIINTKINGYTVNETYKTYPPFTFLSGQLTNPNRVGAGSEGCIIPNIPGGEKEIVPETLDLRPAPNLYYRALAGLADYNTMSLMPKAFLPEGMTEAKIEIEEKKENGEVVPTFLNFQLPVNRMLLYKQSDPNRSRDVQYGPLITIYFDVFDPADRLYKKVSIQWVYQTSGWAVPVYKIDTPIATKDEKKLEFYCKMTTSSSEEGKTVITDLEVYACCYDAPGTEFKGSTALGFGQIGGFVSYPIPMITNAIAGYGGIVYRKTINGFGVEYNKATNEQDGRLVSYGPYYYDYDYRDPNNKELGFYATGEGSKAEGTWTEIGSGIYIIKIAESST